MPDAVGTGSARYPRLSILLASGYRDTLKTETHFHDTTQAVPSRGAGNRIGHHSEPRLSTLTGNQQREIARKAAISDQRLFLGPEFIQQGYVIGIFRIEVPGDVLQQQL